MRTDQHEATEISPLLSEPGEVIPEIAEARTGEQLDSTGAIGNGKPPGDEERQQVGPGATPYQGMPDVKKKMKFILPAIGIGVCLQQRSKTDSSP